MTFSIWTEDNITSFNFNNISVITVKTTAFSDIISFAVTVMFMIA